MILDCTTTLQWSAIGLYICVIIACIVLISPHNHKTYQPGPSLFPSEDQNILNLKNKQKFIKNITREYKL